MLIRSIVISIVLFYCYVTCHDHVMKTWSKPWNRYDFDLGTCHKHLDSFTTRCRTRAESYWGIKNEKEQHLTDRQFCCSAWDYMFCVIEKARKRCNLTELDHMIASSKWKQHQLERNYSCEWFNRDSDYLCHFQWYYYVYLFTGVLLVLSLAVAGVNCLLSIFLKKRRTRMLMKAYENYGYQKDTIQT